MMNWIFVIGATLLTVGLAIFLSKINSNSGSAAAVTNKDFLLGGGNLGPMVVAGTLCATYWSGHAFVGSVGTGYAYGFNQLLGGASYIPALIFSCLFLARFLKRKADKMGALSVVEYTGRIHGSALVQIIGALSNVLLMFVMLLTQFKALGRLLAPILKVDGDIIVLVIGSICVLYTMFGGLKTIAYSDMIMAIGMTIGSIVVVSIVFMNTSLAEMTAKLTAISPELANPTTGEPYGAFKFGALLLIPEAMASLVANPYTATRFLSAKKDMKWWKFGFWCCVFAMAWELLPFVGTYVRSEGVELASADDAMGYFLANHVNSLIMVLVAVCILMAIRSTVDSLLQSISASISYDLRYAIHKGKGMDDIAKNMRINRAVVGVVGVIGIAFNFLAQPAFLVFMGTLGTGTLQSILFGPMFISTFWQGNKYGAIASMIGGGVFTSYMLLTESMMWATAPVVGDLLGAALYVVVSLATFKICPRSDVESAII